MAYDISTFNAPPNFHIIDRNVLRSGQPTIPQFAWLKKQGVTDIINLRSYSKNGLRDFNEEAVVKKLGMGYHHILSVTANPEVSNVQNFLNIIRGVKRQKGKVLFHCYLGSDRTGMYAFIYKLKNNMGNFSENLADMFSKGFKWENYSHLIDWINKNLKKIR